MNEPNGLEPTDGEIADFIDNTRATEVLANTALEHSAGLRAAAVGLDLHEYAPYLAVLAGRLARIDTGQHALAGTDVDADKELLMELLVAGWDTHMADLLIRYRGITELTETERELVELMKANPQEDEKAELSRQADKITDLLDECGVPDDAVTDIAEHFLRMLLAGYNALMRESNGNPTEAQLANERDIFTTSIEQFKLHDSFKSVVTRLFTR